MWLCVAGPVSAGDTPASPFDHSLLDTVLEASVKDGVVNYGQIQKDYPIFQQYLDTLKTGSFDSLPREERLAIGINAYNAYCIRGVLDAGKIRSVRDVWFFFKNTEFILGGKKMTLDSLEHQVLRKMGEPRIHFALVCASKSCPKLAANSYRAETLDHDLDRAAQEFLDDPSKNRLDREAGIFYLSSIFKWFKDDFRTTKGGVLDFIKPWLSQEDQDYLSKNKVKVKFLKYDWSLNGQW
jgi:hypothetical protein